MKKRSFNLILAIGAIWFAGFAANDYLRHSDSEVSASGSHESEMFERCERMLKDNGASFKSFEPVKTVRQSVLPVAPQPGQNVRIAGNVISSAAWPSGDKAVGMYSFRPFGEPELTLLKKDAVISANGGGCCTDEVYCFLNYMRMFGEYYVSLYTYNPDTWEMLSVRDATAAEIALDMTFDRVSGKIYGVFNNDNRNGYVFGTLDLDAVKRTAIADLPCMYYALAADASGDVFGIDEDGNLHKFNKETGVPSLVGPTGFTPKYSQSATFDFESGKMYWAASGVDGETSLFEVNTSTGELTPIYDFKNKEQIVGIYVMPPAAEKGAPNEVENLSLDFSGGSLSGSVLFTAPDYTFGGSPLSGPLTYTVTVNGSEEASGTVEAGQPASVPLTVYKSGAYTVGVSTANAVGNSPAVSTSCWIGNDVPKPVRGLTFTEHDGMMQLEWQAPDGGVNGGWIDFDGLTYRIVRYPDETVVAQNHESTTWSEPVPAGVMKAWHYTVTAVAGGVDSDPATSATLLIGDAFEPPYAENFNSSDAAGIYTVIDADGDGTTWQWDEQDYGMFCSYSKNSPKDDWLITPPIKMTNDRLYTLRYKIRRGSTMYEEKYEVRLGTGSSVDDMTIVLQEEQEIAGRVYKEVVLRFQVPDDGNYNIGFHATSEKYMDKIFITDIKVDADAHLTAPAEVGELAVVAGPRGELSAKVSFVAPSVAVDDSPLSEVTKIEIYRDDEYLETLSPIELDAPYEYVDYDVTAGMHEYGVMAYNGLSRGMMARKSVFVGKDIPGLPRNITLTEGADNLTLTWEPPAAGRNGGYVDPESLTYCVIDMESELIKDGLTECRFDFVQQMSAPQDLFAYYVAAVTNEGMGNGARSNVLAIGTPHELPYADSFAGAANMTEPWGLHMNGKGGRWYISASGSSPMTLPVDRDGGLITFIPEAVGDDAILYSGKIALGDADHPALEFYYFNDGNVLNDLSVVISRDHSMFTEFATVDYQSAEIGWNLARIPLDDYLSSDFIQLGFKGVANDKTQHLHVDNLRVRDIYAHDMQLDRLTVPSVIKVGNSGIVSAEVINAGSETVDGYDVEFYGNGELLATVAGGRLAPMESAVCEAEIVPDIDFDKSVTIRAVIVYAADSDLSNNVKTADAVSIAYPAYPAVSDLSASCDDAGCVTLEWSALSDCVMPAEPVTDDIESYAPFIIENIGEWTLVDVDGGPGTYTIKTSSGESVLYDNASKPMAFQVFNPGLAGLMLVNSEGNPTAWMPHSGSQMLATFADVDGQNDDWLISPELTGEAQTLTFYARSYRDIYGLETIEVLTSSTDMELGSFTRIREVASEVPAAWVQYVVALPEGTKYFAIRCTSKDVFALLIDDITFTPASSLPLALTLEGYNVYRDGEKITETPVTDARYDDAVGLAPVRHAYKVTAQYDAGESVYSNEVEIATLGIVDRSMDGVNVYAVAGAIVIEGLSGQHVSVFTPDGRMSYSGVAMDSDLRIAAAPGVYIVAVGGGVVKVMVD